MGCYKNLILIIESNESCFFFLLKGIHQKMLILHQGTLNKVTLNKGTLLKDILNKGTLNKVTHLNSMLNSLSRTKKLGFLKDGMSPFLFFFCSACVIVEKCVSFYDLFILFLFKDSEFLVRVGGLQQFRSGNVTKKKFC